MYLFATEVAYRNKGLSPQLFPPIHTDFVVEHRCETLLISLLQTRPDLWSRVGHLYGLELGKSKR